MVGLLDKYWHPYKNTILKLTNHTSSKTLIEGRGFSRFDLRRQLLMEDSLRAILGPTILKEIKPFNMLLGDIRDDHARAGDLVVSTRSICYRSLAGLWPYIGYQLQRPCCFLFDFSLWYFDVTSWQRDKLTSIPNTSLINSSGFTSALVIVFSVIYTTCLRHAYSFLENWIYF